MPFEKQKRCQLLPGMIVLAVVSARDTITDCDGFVAEKCRGVVTPLVLLTMTIVFSMPAGAYFKVPGVRESGNPQEILVLVCAVHFILYSVRIALVIPCLLVLATPR